MLVLAGTDRTTFRSAHPCTGLNRATAPETLMPRTVKSRAGAMALFAVASWPVVAVWAGRLRGDRTFIARAPQSDR